MPKVYSGSNCFGVGGVSTLIQWYTQWRSQKIIKGGGVRKLVSKQKVFTFWLFDSNRTEMFGILN